ncbi:TonB-dependent receptor [Chitinophaga nivalis]|uniref:TonB-dependent receptor n=1 Tax=Chitinophaga nivalis TaxID=2991709 RepID=A0ABT3IRP5_9BACT|nr:TonB-dependent receptor [Chitinophaga nivalis]MCW3463679.1 TonB-dependent receptor [Chitinophaga nivalis]MCW3486631.1 TonB-dependent receptor [Chitinophaga nivalis]
MKLSAILMLAACLQLSAKSYSQRLQLSLHEVSLSKVFTVLQQQSDYSFVYTESQLRKAGKITLQLKNSTLQEALDSCLANQPLTYTIRENMVIIQDRPEVVAPPIAVSGVVVDESGQPLPGVSVGIKGSRTGGITNASGTFALSDVPPDAVLVFSFIGYQTQEIPLNGRPLIKLVLKTAPQALDEKVVIGYGNARRRDLTGSIAKVASLRPEQNMSSNTINGLQGRVAGLFVKQDNSAPGALPIFTIRGVQTLQVNDGGTGANPLIVVDGLVIDANPSGANANYSLGNLNPQDIESMEVLKDAASCAMYGARGAQGVILITTRKGNFNSRPRVSLNAYWGITKTNFDYKPLNTSEYGMIFREARDNRISDIDQRLAAGGLTPAQVNSLNNEKRLLNAQINNLQMGSADNNWIKKIMPAQALTRNIQSSLSGGGDKTSYYLSFGQYSEDNSLGTGNFTRYSGKLAVTQKVYDWFKAGADINISNTRSRDIYSDLSGALAVRPDTPDSITHNEDGTYGYSFGRQEHPYARLKGYNRNIRTWNYVGNFFGEITLPKNFSFRTMLAASKSSVLTESFDNPLSYEGQSTKGKFFNDDNKGLRYTWNNVLSYRYQTGKWRGDAVLGQEYTDNAYQISGFALQGFPMSESLWAPGNASGYDNSVASKNRRYRDVSQSFFFRSNVSWDNKYLLSISLRRDGSSKLKDYRYAWFPAVSGGWVISSESFMQQQKWISYLKVRASYGLTGNIRPLGQDDVSSLINTTTYLTAPALQLSNRLGNPGLKWERTHQQDIGLEARLFNDRLSATIEYYNKKTDGLLSAANIPWSSGGYITQRVNLGAMENRGVDIAINYSNTAQRTDGFKWTIGTVVNINRNRVTQLRDSIVSYGAYYPAGPIGYAVTGQPVGLLKIYQANGIDNQTGDVIYEDVNKDGIINEKDMRYVQVAQPKWNGGFNLDLSWKGFTASAQFIFTVGNKVYNLSDQFARFYGLDNSTGVMENMPDWVLERWTKPGDNSHYPRVVTGAHGAGQTTDWNNRPSTLYLFDGSFLRFKNLTVGYDFAGRVVKSKAFEQLRLYAAVQNIFLIKDRGLKSGDPEQALESGMQLSVVPMPRTASIGIDVRF